MIRLDPSTGTFTSFHLNFIHLCMETRSYAAAEPILDNYIHNIPSKIPTQVREGLEYSVPCADVATSGDYIHQGSGHSEKVTLTDLQEYYLLGAMAYLGARKFKKAQQLLEHVLVVPSANVANGFMLEAYKKWVLVSCLVHSTVREPRYNVNGISNKAQDRVIPRTTNANAIKQVKSASKAYEALAEAYTQLGNMSKLKVQVKFGAEIWAEVSYRKHFVSLSAGANKVIRMVTPGL
jgi:COP9 signalosome complex subunit 3